MSIASSNLTLEQLLDGMRAISRIQPMQTKINTAFEQTEYHFMNTLAKEGRRSEQGGDTIQMAIELSKDGTVNRLSSPYDELPVSAGANVHNITANWKHYHKGYMINRVTIAAAKDGKYSKKLMDEVNLQRLKVAKDFAGTFENDMFTLGPSSTDTSRIYSLYYWFPKALAGVEGAGYLGTTAEFLDGTSTTTIGGIDSTAANTNGLWRSPVVTYDAFDNTFVRKSSEMFHKLNFQAPDNAEDLAMTRTSNFKIVAGENVILELEDIARANGDAFGSNIGMLRGQLMVRGIPVRKASILDGDTDMPLFFYNLAYFSLLNQEGWWFMEDEPMRDGDRRLAVLTDVHTRAQVWCENRRMGGGVMHKARPAA